MAATEIPYILDIPVDNMQQFSSEESWAMYKCCFLYKSIQIGEFDWDDL